MSDWKPMATVPREKIVWLFAGTDCSDWVKPRLARWTTPNGCAFEDGEWWEEETDCTIDSPQCWHEAIIPDHPTDMEAIG